MYKILKTISDTLSGKASIFIILTAIITYIHPELFVWVKGNTQTVILGIIMLTMGLTLTIGRLANFSTAKKRTISIEVGMQNAGLGTNLAMTFFVATNPMAVVPCAISCAWHSISGTILANIFAAKDKK